MKRAFASLLIALGAVALTSSAGQATLVSFNPSSQTVQQGAAVSVDVVVSSLDAGEFVSAYDLDVLYNPAILTATDVVFGALLGGPANSLQGEDLATAGRIDFFEVSFLSDVDLDSLQGTSVILATLKFIAKAPGTSSLTFDPGTVPGVEGQDIKGALGALLDVDAATGSVTVQRDGPPQVPEPSSLLFLGAGAAWVAARAIRRRA